jgi:D-beta-D-heptose 7-phosphate kinase/D-beta-D-heptose 1-phosphate adenosyltransferase
MPKSKPKILVIGESCKDIFIYCDATRLCPDAPVPVLNIINQSENPGMAKNVQRNIRSFIPCDIITNDNWFNISKTRYVHQESNHLFIRVDTPHNIDSINLETIDYDYDIIVISDYNKGFLSENDIENICLRHPLVFLDTKKILGKWAKKAKFIKINNYEFKNSEKFIDDDLYKKIIRTKGSDGCYFMDKNYPVLNKADVKDTSGAGDSFISALVVKYLETSNIEESIIFANDCASKVVSQRGVTII